MRELLNFFLHKDQYINIDQLETLDSRKGFINHAEHVPELGDLDRLISSEEEQPGSAIEYIDQLFSALNKGLEQAGSYHQLQERVTASLNELLIRISFEGAFLQDVAAIKKDLGKGRNFKKCLANTKALLIAYFESIRTDQHEVQEFLKVISNRLAGIYSEMSEAQGKCADSVALKEDAKNAVTSGIQQIKHSIETSHDVEDIKLHVNQLVDALQNRVVANLEKDMSETQILEKKIVGLTVKLKSLEDHAQDLEQKVRKKQLEAITDPLTGLFNRAGYIQMLERAWLEWQENQTPSTLLVWDIDHFKQLNDHHGHAAGDKVLQSVAKKLAAGVREGDIVARFGGEEFVMLLIGKTVKEGSELAERVRSIIADTEFTYKKQPMNVTISCGVASFIKNDTPTTLFERADKALYKAKRSGRNKVEVIVKKVA